ncbi:Tol-Pal system protein TolB [Helicobacter cetorum]|uniref:Translocation protein TolB n=1 Tax=Helicobacter cetorum (strain ATCC BAA-429 / MIT 00-7128) TaxID=182217 RepID=I0EPR4_HELC0|nr:Tol-Pal system protein TolB [Helicobacter cetorum]AFI04933.1 translocation protein TolB [Helicobacter cetorum MIT 00-7128]
MKQIWVLLMFCMGLLAADKTLDVVKTIQKLPKVEIRYSKENDATYVFQLHEVLMNDLKVSQHFEVFDAGEQKGSLDYATLKGKNIRLVALLSVVVDNGNKVAQLKLYDVNASTLKKTFDYPITHQDLYPFAAHKMAITINDYIKAPSIAWMDRLVVFSKYVQSGVTTIALGDYTMRYQKEIIKNGRLNVFPKWADAKQTEFYYTQYGEKTPMILKYNIQKGTNEFIAESQGMAVVSSVNADGSKVLMSLSPEGQPDVYLYDTHKKTKTKLTRYRGIDVLGVFFENEKSMVFVSDRAGYPNIYLKKLGLKDSAEQLLYEGKSNESIDAHKGNIVYVSRENPNEFGKTVFNLNMISAGSNYIRRLTVNGSNQMPRFSIDGSNVMYLKKTPEEESVGLILLDYNQSFLFPLKDVKIQAFDW